THVIHYHFPDDPENYIHRSGRTGRAGKKGISIAILAPSETRRLGFLEKQTGKKLTKRQIPTGDEVFELRLQNHLRGVAASDTEQFDIQQYAHTIQTELQDLSREEIIEKFIAAQFNRLHKDYSNATDLHVTAADRKTRIERGPRVGGGAGVGRNDKFARYSINIGAKNNLRPDVLISIINRQTPDRKIAIGKIDIQSKVSYFEAESSHERHLIQAFKKARFKGMSLMVQSMDGERGGERRSEERRVGRE